MTTNPATEPPVSRGNTGRYWALLLVAAAILTIAFVRVRLRDCPLERDEGEYAYAGQLMLQGIPPYQLVYNMKFPGTYAAYALILAVFGQTPAGIHVGVMCVTSLTALLVYWLGRKLADEWFAATAAALSVFFSATPTLYGLAGHATHFAAMFVAAGLCFFWPAEKRTRPANLIVGGLMFGLAILMKQHAAIIALWGLVVLTFGTGSITANRPLEKLRALALYCLGVLLPFLVTCLVLWRAGVFEKFWFWTITYAREYVSNIPLKHAPILLWMSLSHLTLSSRPLWILAAAGLVLLCLDRRKPAATRVELIGLLLASFLTTCPGYYFRIHYFLLMTPVIALLGAYAVERLHRLLKPEPSLANTTILGVCMLVLSGIAFDNRNTWFKFPPRLVSRVLYGPNPFIEAEQVANYIRTNSTPSDVVAILGSEPEIFFLAHRRSATGYIYVYPLMEPQPFSHQMQLEMISQIEQARPKFIVTAMANYSWLQQPDSDRTLTTWWPAACRPLYSLVGIAEVATMTESDYCWGRNLSENQARHDSVLYTYQRRDTLPAPDR